MQRIIKSSDIFCVEIEKRVEEMLSSIFRLIKDLHYRLIY